MEKLSREERERIFYAIVSVLGRPKSFLHIGCGDGWLVRAARQLMCRPAIGIGTQQDHEDARKWAAVVVRDITRPFEFRGEFDLVLTFSRSFHIATAARLLDNNGHLVMPDSLYPPFGIDLKSDFDATDRLSSALGSKSFEVYECTR